MRHEWGRREEEEEEVEGREDEEVEEMEVETEVVFLKMRAFLIWMKAKNKWKLEAGAGDTRISF